MNIRAEKTNKGGAYAILKEGGFVVTGEGNNILEAMNDVITRQNTFKNQLTDFKEWTEKILSEVNK